jgi:hypothetical protein
MNNHYGQTPDLVIARLGAAAEVQQPKVVFNLMKATLRRVLLAVPVAAVLVLSSSVGRAAAPATPQGFITEKDFLNLPTGTGIAGMTNSLKFPDLPDAVYYPTLLEIHPNADTSTTPGGNPLGLSEYGSQVAGYFYPPTTGLYVFYVCSDDPGSLYLSTDSNPANKKLIAVETAWSNPRQYTTSSGGSTLASKRSDQYVNTNANAWPGGGTNIILTAGQPYYIEALFREGGGGDNLSVSINATNPIPGAYLSSFDRPDLTSPYFVALTGHAGGFWGEIQEVAGGTQVDFNSVQATLNGNSVSVTSTRRANDSRVAVSYLASPLLAVGSTNSVTINFTAGAVQQSATRTFVVGGYSTIPADYAVSSATDQGFTVHAYQMSVAANPGQNSIGSAEHQWARGFINPTNSLPYDNLITPDTYPLNDVINWNINPSRDFDTDLNPNAAEHGNWQAGLPAPYNFEDQYFPGIGFIGGTYATAGANFVNEIISYVQLSPGFYRMGVNSDDGFKVTTAPGAPNPFGLVLGSFDGGRGSDNTFFDFSVTAAGYYPFRLLYWQGGGDGNLEWFTVNLSTGDKVLVNDTFNAAALIPYQTAQDRAYVDTVLPGNGYTGGATNQTVSAVLKDGTTIVVPGSVHLWQDGVQVNATIVGPTAGTTTVSYQKPGGFSYSETHTNVLIWTESTVPPKTWTNTFTFQTRQFGPDDLPSYTTGSFWIEAEDFDATGTTVPTNVNTMPYNLGAATGTPPGPYTGIGATLNVDYFNNDALDNTTPTTYRSTGDPNISGRSVDLARDDGANYGLRRPRAFDMTANYKIGWGDSADWYNYTRKVPAGLYTAYIALSLGDAAVGTPHTMGGTLSIVTNGVGTPNQSLKLVGTFDGPSSGAWSYNNLVPLYAADLVTKAAFKITSATTTLRFSLRRGDYDWFVLIPVTGVPPAVTAASPAANTAGATASPVPRNAKVRLTIEDFSSAVVQSSVKLLFDNVDVTSTATITKPADITSVTYDPGLLAAGSTHSYELRFTDNGSPAKSQTNIASFVVNAVLGTPGQFVIEAEDFNYDSGKTLAPASTMPYLGAAYTNLGATMDVDYHIGFTPFGADCGNADTNAPCAWLYRTGIPAVRGSAVLYVPISVNANGGTLDTVRGDQWDVTANYAIGWVGDGNWFNYTRNFPTNTYSVWAALAHDPGGGLQASLNKVTSDPAQPNQTLVQLGTFTAPTSGAWGDNNVVQMKDTGGSPAIISLGGTQTIRWDGNSGDLDYLVFVPAPLPLQLTSVTLVGPSSLSIGYSVPGGGTATLESTSALNANPTVWTTVDTVTGVGSITVPVAATGQKFYHLKQTAAP